MWRWRNIWTKIFSLLPSKSTCFGEDFPFSKLIVLAVFFPSVNVKCNRVRHRKDWLLIAFCRSAESFSMPLYHQNPSPFPSLSLTRRARARAFFYTPKLLLSTSTDGKKQFLLLSVTRLCFRPCPCLPRIFFSSLLSQHHRRKKKKKKKERKYFCVCAYAWHNERFAI